MNSNEYDRRPEARTLVSVGAEAIENPPGRERRAPVGGRVGHSPKAILDAVKPIIVLGMHRSGASALAQAIGRLGASRGDTARLAAGGENVPLRRLNDALLEAAGGAWDAPPAGADWLSGAAARALAERAARTLTAELGSTGVAVWKDPRTSLTLPFWLEHLTEEPVVVLVHRHPAEVVASLQSAGVTGSAHAFALWERYNAAALSAATGLPTIVLDYGQVMAFPGEAAAFLAKALGRWGVELPHDPAATDVGLAPALRHHLAPRPDQLGSPAATPSQAELFGLLDAVAGAHRPLRTPRPVPPTDPVSAEILAMAGTIRALERDRRHARQSERKAKRSVKRAVAGAGSPVSTEPGR